MQPLGEAAAPAGLLAAILLRDDPDARKVAPIEISPVLVALLADDTIMDDNWQ